MQCRDGNQYLYTPPALLRKACSPIAKRANVLLFNSKLGVIFEKKKQKTVAVTTSLLRDTVE
tara:strand:+ start:354 stop:539 length:186 start_codon:yes stop_codon:yes gene_type:complete